MADPSVAAYVRTLTVDWPKLQQKQAKDLLIKFAREGNAKTVAEQTARAGVPPDVTSFANTPGNTNLESVILPGPIVYLYRYHNEIIKEALRLLEEASPVDSGEYKRNHTLYINGTPAPRNAKFERGDDVMIVNVVPYARRIEIGKTKAGRDFLVSVPNRIYHRVGDQLNQRYGKVANISMDFIGLGTVMYSGDVGPSRSIKSGKVNIKSKDRKGRGSPDLYPALLIETR